MNPLNHTQARQLLQVSADYRLEPAEQAALDAHLTGCPECQAYASGITAIEGDLRRIFHRQWDAAAARSLNLLPGVRTGYRRNQARRQYIHYASALITVALIVGFIALLNAFLAFRQNRPPAGALTPSATMDVTATPSPTLQPSPSATPTGKALETQIGSPASPPFGALAFVSSRLELGDLYQMNTDGSGQTRLFDDQLSLSLSPAWSPDGTKLAFVSNRDGNSEIYSVNVDGSNLARLTDDPASDLDPAWSPDGQRIAFSSDRSGYREIYVLEINTSQVTRLTTTQSANVHPTWSPDGKYLAFSTNRDGYWQIYRMQADGSEPTNLSNDPAFDDRQPAWSPDGERIAFSMQPVGSQDHLIATMNADGSGRISVTQQDEASNSPAGDYDPAWSPDNQWIAFWSNRENTVYGDIYLVHLDPMPASWEVVLRLTNEGGSQPAWRP